MKNKPDETKLYYTAPSDELFVELKQKAIEIWEKYDNTHGFADEKIGKISNLENVRDNFMYIVAMFDIQNQMRLAKILSLEANEAIAMRYLSGGGDPAFCPFILAFNPFINFFEKT